MCVCFSLCAAVWWCVLLCAGLLEHTALSLEQQQYVTMIGTSGHLLLTIINGTLQQYTCYFDP